MAIKIFISYASEDEKLLNRLKTHLKSLERQGIIDIWYDRNISAGQEMDREISKNLNAAQIILLLISPDFMASDYLYSVEVKRAMESHEHDDARVIPVLLRSSYWDGERYKKLRATPVKEKEAVPVISSFWHNEDEALVEVVKDIRDVALKLTHPCNILFYNAWDGKGEFYSIDDRGDKVFVEGVHWPEKWTHIVSGNFTGGKHTDLFLYKDETGEAKFSIVSKYGKIDDIKNPPECQSDWTLIIPGKFTDNNYTDLLFYSASANMSEIYTTDGHGKISRLSTYKGWQGTWTHIIPGKFVKDSKYNDLLFYNNKNGVTEFYTISSEGVLQPVKPRPNWCEIGTSIVSGKFIAKHTYHDLLFYNGPAQQGRFLKTDGKGDITPVKKEPSSNWHKNWLHIVPGNFIQSGYRGLLFHDPKSGRVKIRTTDGQGGLKDEIVHENGPQHSTQVVYLSPE